MAGAATAERQFTRAEADREFAAIVANLESEPTAFSMAETPEGDAVRQQAAKFVGAVLGAHEFRLDTVQSAETMQPIESLYDAIMLAAEGDERARKMVETNVSTDVIERTLKAGHILSVDLMVNEAGDIRQHGQPMESVQANSLRLMEHNPQMLARTIAEANNAFYIKQAFLSGKLEDYSLVVLSRAPDDMTIKEMQDWNFFTDTMSCAVQVTSLKNGHLQTESAFVAGVTKPGGVRHDRRAAAGIGRRLNVNLDDKDATETLVPMLVPNKLIPNGAIDIVKMWDEETGSRTFFGQDQPKQDYLAYQKQCVEREAGFQPRINKIVAELISLAPILKGRVHASQLLNKLSGKHMVEHAITDTSINPAVFGQTAAYDIEAARYHAQQGDWQRANNFIEHAKKVQTSSSCPGKLHDKNEFDQDDNNEESNASELEDCEFVSKECPKCNKKNVRTTVTDGVYIGECGCRSDED